LAVFVPAAVWLSTQPNFQLERLWQVSVITVWIQAGVSYALLRREFGRRLVDAPPADVPPQAAQAQAALAATAESGG
jgi:hypothetical protein